MINASEAREDDPEFQSPVDLMFERLEEKDPEHFAVRQYKKFLLVCRKNKKLYPHFLLFHFVMCLQCWTAFGQEHNFSVSGKVKQNAPYRLSVGYTNQNGVIRTNNYERFTFNGGISPKFFDNHLTVDLNLKVSYENNKKVDESVVNNALLIDFLIILIRHFQVSDQP